MTTPTNRLRMKRDPTMMNAMKKNIHAGTLSLTGTL
jgi:hypothetical protein